MSTKALERYLAPLMPFLKMPGVTEICINKPQEVFIEQHSQFQQYEILELELEFIQMLAALIAEYNQKPFPAPIISGVLPTGERVQFVMNPACESIVCAIRKHQMREMTLENYLEAGAFNELTTVNEKTNINEALTALYEKKEILNFLKLAILSRKNIIISGGTGTGKTTFLNACLKLIPLNERLATVEDTREVFVNHPNVIHLLFNEDNAQITAAKVFKTTLRLRPDRIFLSEMRGAEAWSYLRAANSGHPGSLSTVHADTPEGCFEQMVFMMQQAGSTSTEENLKKYIKSIVNIVIQLKRCASNTRFMYVSEIYFDKALE